MQRHSALPIIGIGSVFPRRKTRGAMSKKLSRNREVGTAIKFINAIARLLSAIAKLLTEIAVLIVVVGLY
jgi:hypothetical protein